MRIITICRTLNEEKNINRFCEAYSFSDKILIADGGSIDKTREMASKYSGVEVRHFSTMVERNGVKRNPHGKHINFMISWALEEKASWIIFDDCDCVPNNMLKSTAREIFARVDGEDPLIHAHRMYIFGQDQWFPELNKSGQSLWAWNPHAIYIYAADLDWKHRLLYGSSGEMLNGIRDDQIHKLDWPLALLHRAWPDEDEIQRKLNFYRATTEQPLVKHPREWAGQLEPLPDWAKE